MSSAYLTHALNPVGRKTIVRRIVSAIKKSGVSFNAVACRGVSGLVIAPIIAHYFNKPLVVVRKPGELSQDNCHGFEQIEVSSSKILQYYIIIDDLVSSGETIGTIVDDIKTSDQDIIKQANCAGVFLYESQVQTWSEIQRIIGAFIPVFVTHPTDIKHKREIEKFNRAKTKLKKKVDRGSTF